MSGFQAKIILFSELGMKGDALVVMTKDVKDGIRNLSGISYWKDGSMKRSPFAGNLVAGDLGIRSLIAVKGDWALHTEPQADASHFPAQCETMVLEGTMTSFPENTYYRRNAIERIR